MLVSLLAGALATLWRWILIVANTIRIHISAGISIRIHNDIRLRRSIYIRIDTRASIRMGGGGGGSSSSSSSSTVVVELVL